MNDNFIKFLVKTDLDRDNLYNNYRQPPLYWGDLVLSAFTHNSYKSIYYNVPRGYQRAIYDFLHHPRLGQMHASVQQQIYVNVNAKTLTS